MPYLFVFCRIAATGACNLEQHVLKEVQCVILNAASQSLKVATPYKSGQNPPSASPNVEPCWGTKTHHPHAAGKPKVLNCRPA